MEDSTRHRHAHDLRRVLEPDDLSFLRRGGELGLGSDRAHTVPSALMRFDAVYNFSRRTPGLACERSGGPFIFFDVDGRALPYLLWRRTQAHAITPRSRSIDDIKWAPDLQFPPKPIEATFSLVETNEGARIHGVNSDDVEEWVRTGRRIAPLGVDLLVSLGHVELDIDAILYLCSEILATGGDLVLAAPSDGRRKASSLLPYFESVYEGHGMIVALSRSFLVGEGGEGRVVEDLVDILDLGADDEDPLRVWLACEA